MREFLAQILASARSLMEDGTAPESVGGTKLVRVRPVGMILNESVDWQEATKVVRDVDGGEPVAYVPFFE